MNGKRVWLYCRVASRENSVELLEMQKQRLSDYAQEHEFEVAGCSSDTASGLTMDRPGLLEFHAAVKAGEVDVLLIYSLTCLGHEMNKVIKY